MKMPVFFAGHGSPMNIVSQNEFTRALHSTANSIGNPEAIVVISAHWLTRGTKVTGNASPSIIYDFYGFPEELFEIKYPCKGHSVLAEKIRNTLPDQIKTDPEYGLDHAVWSVLIHMYPNADIPVIAVSLDISKSYKEHFEIAKKLRFLRDQNVLVIASGNVVHNLRQINFNKVDAPAFEWAKGFNSFIEKSLTARDTEAILDPFRFSDFANLAIPTDDHYLPLLYFMGFLDDNENIRITHNSIQHGSVSMLCCISE